MTPWTVGDSNGMLEDMLFEYINFWMTEGTYTALLPNIRIHLAKQGSEAPVGVCITPVVSREIDSSLIVSYNSREVIEESHAISLVIRDDRRSGGVGEIEKVVAFLKAIFLCNGTSRERLMLIDKGIYNLFESADAMLVDPGTAAGPSTGTHTVNDLEGIFFSQALSLVCNTDTYLKPE